MKDRVATLGLLNKRNNVEQDLKMKPGETRRIGDVIVRLESCERTAPWEMPEETGAFVQVFVRENARFRDSLRKIFSGWLFKKSPSLNVVEHPIYDVWVKDCAMRFPGEAEPEAFADRHRPLAAQPARASAWGRLHRGHPERGLQPGEIVFLRDRHRAQRSEMFGHELAVEQPIAGPAQSGDQPGERDLAGIGGMAEHALAAKYPIEGHAI